MYVNVFVLGVLATLFVEMALIITAIVCYGIYSKRRSHTRKKG